MIALIRRQDNGIVFRYALSDVGPFASNFYHGVDRLGARHHGCHGIVAKFLIYGQHYPFTQRYFAFKAACVSAVNCHKPWLSAEPTARREG